MRINNRGYWENPTDIGHAYDSKLANAILLMLKKNGVETLVDFGCGKADYVKLFKRHGIYCEAYDGNPNTKELSGGLGSVLDLSEYIDLDEGFDCVMSLEVGEHIPADYEQTFIDNLCRHCYRPGLILLSWAIPGQDGDGHVNCQPNEYIIEKLMQKGYELDEIATAKLRKSASLWWFKNTLMLFR
jgi:hypothetical protein